MISLVFDYLGEKILVVIEGKNIKFGNTAYGAGLASIEGLKLNYAGVCREFPDLEMNPRWREEVIKRFKWKIEELKTEKEIENYIISDLKKYGYIPKKRQVKGFRMEDIKS
jgi:hypothetical protein